MDYQSRRKLGERLFPQSSKTLVNLCISPWNRLSEISDWVSEFNNNPEWKGRNYSEMMADNVSGASEFYHAFTRWTKKECTNSNGTINQNKRKQLKKRLFLPILTKYAHLTSIDDWVSEFEKHPEWQGRSTHQMRKDKESGANAFYQAFRKWTKEDL